MIFTSTYGIFSLKHIIILVVCIAAIVAGVIFGRKLKLNTLLKILLIIGIVSESIKVIYYIITNETTAVKTVEGATFDGYLPKTDLPFHLCSIQIIFVLILNIVKNEKVRKVILSFMLPTCLVGGIAALFIATSSSLNGLWILSLQYFGYHAAISTFAIILLISKEVKFNIKDFRNCLLMLVATFFVAIYINSAIADYVHDINFMYVVNPPMNGLPFLNKDHGWGVYIVHYACLCVIAVALVYIVPIINFFKKEKAEETPSVEPIEENKEENE